MYFFLTFFLITKITDAIENNRYNIEIEKNVACRGPYKKISIFHDSPEQSCARLHSLIEIEDKKT